MSDDTNPMRLARIERKINSIGNVVRGAIALALGYTADKIIEDQLGLGGTLGMIAAAAAFLGFCYYSRREFENE